MKRIQRTGAVLLLLPLLVVSTEALATGGTEAHASALSFRWRGIQPEPLRHKGSVSFLFETNGARNVRVSYEVTDSDGDEVARASDIRRRSGNAAIDWNTRSGDGSPVIPGLYR